MDRECGDDGCGGDCGACNAKDQCDEETGLCLAPEDPYSYIEVEGDAMSWNDSYAPGTNTPCDPGERLVYGKCVAEEGSDGGKDVDSSCSVSARPSSGAMWLLLALFAVLGWRRRSA